MCSSHRARSNYVGQHSGKEWIGGIENIHFCQSSFLLGCQKNETLLSGENPCKLLSLLRGSELQGERGKWTLSSPEERACALFRTSTGRAESYRSHYYSIYKLRTSSKHKHFPSHHDKRSQSNGSLLVCEDVFNSLIGQPNSLRDIFIFKNHHYDIYGKCSSAHCLQRPSSLRGGGLALDALVFLLR